MVGPHVLHALSPMLILDQDFWGIVKQKRAKNTVVDVLRSHGPDDLGISVNFGEEKISGDCGAQCWA
jgi:hypothetical protein